MFRSFRIFNYRVWACGAIVSNVGTWMQRTAQDWLVLAELTKHNATAVGFVMALQFGPQLVLLPLTGFVADRFDRRTLLFATQGAQAMLALCLGLLTVTHMVQLWEVYIFALILGCVTAFDAPVRQTFVAELVGDTELSNAVALNSTSFNAGRMIGPAVAGVLIAYTGTGWVFLINALSFVGVITSLSLLRMHELHSKTRAVSDKSALLAGFRYILARSDLKTICIMALLLGTFGINFPIFISSMSVMVFHADARQFGLLSSIMAIGSILGALMAASREKPSIAVVCIGSACFALGLAGAALMPNYWLFSLMLIVVGAAAQTCTTSLSTLAQLTTEPAMRGRVIAILLAIILGSTPVGAPIVGWVADTYGPRWSLGIGALACAIAAYIGLRYLRLHGHVETLIHFGET
jgi:MFS family permease